MSKPTAATYTIDNRSWIDRAKGICIILVVMMHTALGVEKVLGQTGFLHAIVAWTKPFRMPDFFLLSGFLAGTIGSLSWRAFADRRIVNYLYFYLLWLAILTSLKLASDGALSVDSFIRSYAMGFIEPFSTLWFIYVLPVFMVVARFSRGWLAWAIGIIATVLHVWAAAYPEGGVYAMSSQAFGWIAPDSIALFLIFFLSGYLGRSWIDRIPDLIRMAPRMGVAVLLFWAGIHSCASIAGVTSIPGLTIAFGLSGALAILILAVLIERGPALDWLAYCGRHSLAIYLAFVIPMAASRSLLVGKLGVTQPDIVMVTVLACAVLFPLVLERLVQPGPLRFLFVRPEWTRLIKTEARL
mgnify:CR=1 FL=1